MPELPEVEVTRRSFAGSIAGSTVLSVALGKPLRWPLGCSPESLIGRHVLTVDRRGKYLLLRLSRGMLLIHLGMSGSLRFGSLLPPSGPHEHFDLVTSVGVLRLHDPRRFGAIVYAESDADPVAHKLLGHLGAEPLSDSFHLAEFAEALKRSRASIKPLLLAGRLVVGVGNIYASEVLFLAGIHPLATAQKISKKQVKLLHQGIRQVLERAVLAGGTTLRDFSSADGMTGHFQHETQVYGRAGAPCRRCSTRIELFKQGQRSSYFCPKCQPA